MRSVAITAILSLLASRAHAQGPANSDPAAVAAGQYTVEAIHTRIQFSISHMGFTDWFGDFTGASGTLRLDPDRLAATVLSIEIPVASVSTTNAILDGELKSAEWLHAGKFPTIRFVATRVERTAANAAAITGNLTFHGVTRPVVLDARFNGVGVDPIRKRYTVGFAATVTIKHSDLGVVADLPLIGDAVSLRISAAFEK
jgi:polyisoprenoid-binding protein YceI